MKSTSQFCFAMAVVIILAMAAPSYAIDTPNLDGIWQGSLHFKEGSFAFDPIDDAKSTTDVKLRIDIHGPVVNVFFGRAEGEGSPGAFHIAQVKSNAIIFGTEYLQGDGPGWTESMTMIVTPKDDKTLFISFSRLVSNTGFEDRKDNVKFAEHVDGELTRVAQ